MQRNPFIEVIVRSCVRVRRTLPFHPPDLLPFSIQKCRASGRARITRDNWPREHCANEPFGFLNGAVRAAAVLWLLASLLQATGAVREVGPIELTVNDLNREVQFFTNVLPFQFISETRTARGAADDLLGLKNTELRIAELQLGAERVRLTEHVVNKGRAIPADSRSFDHWFQHMAIVVSDMDRAYERLRAHKVKHVSTAPQTLPPWNKEAGGIKAFYFRDPEDHVLEIIWFPPGKGDPKWQEPTTKPGSGLPLFLGIDHTAIVVGDTDRSLRFYTNVLGLHVTGGAENYGTEQEHLNQVFGARLRITALRAERGPGIELLEYIAPPGGRPFPWDARANDLVFWRTHLLVPNYDFISDGKGGMHARPISTSGASGSFIYLDPDGHALQLHDARAPKRSADRLSAVSPTAGRLPQENPTARGIPIRDTAD
jgi:catechol 2,3-dioxygenase-like lactoylglutathione lyase family enzyme